MRGCFMRRRRYDKDGHWAVHEVVLICKENTFSKTMMSS